MTIGEKIKKVRIEKELTQSELAGAYITRNMLSAIENNKANPSMDTIIHLANQLDLPLSYLVSDDCDIFLYKKAQAMPNILAAFKSNDYKSCISFIDNIEGRDDELNYLLAISYFEIGVRLLRNGSFKSANKYLKLAQQHGKSTAYETKTQEALIPLYIAVTENVNSPTLNFDTEVLYSSFNDIFDMEFVKYILNDVTFPYKQHQYIEHMRAKQLIKERKYYEAINIMLTLADSQKRNEYNSYLVFNLYLDLENCYRQVCDFENAYRYVTKRLSLLEGFDS